MKAANTAIREQLMERWPAIRFRACPDPEGDIGSSFGMVMPSADTAAAFNRALGAENINTVQLYGGNPVHYTPDMCPRAIDLIARTVWLPVSPPVERPGYRGSGRWHHQGAAGIAGTAGDMERNINTDVCVWTGSHSNLGSQEIFFRAGGLMHVSAILDEGTLLSSGALRSMAVERTPGYAQIVMDDYQLSHGDLLIIVNAYDINSATIDAALEAKRRGIRTIAVTSVEHASSTPDNHPERHPSKRNLHDIADIVLDSKVPVGDTIAEIDGLDQKVAAISTFANAFLLNALVAETVELLVQAGVQPPIWTSGNASGGDEANGRHLDRFNGRVKKL